MARVLAGYGRRHGQDAPLAAVAGEWSKQYFAKIMRPVAAAAIMLDWRMPFSPENISIDLGHEGDIVSLGLSSFGGPVAATSAEDRFDFLIRNNVAAIIHSVAEASGLSRNVLWSNAGNVLEGIVSSDAARVQHPADGFIDAVELLETPVFTDGTRNPLYRPIVYPVVCGRPKRLRRVCCIRYLLDALDYCTTCPCPGRSQRLLSEPRQ